jgi:hypothetical protein
MENMTEKQLAYFDKILVLVKTFRPDVYEAIKSQVNKEDCIFIAKNIRYQEIPEGSKIVAIRFWDYLYARCIKKPEIMKEADPYQYRAFEILKPFLEARNKKDRTIYRVYGQEQ